MAIELPDDEAEKIIKSIVIPPRPTILTELMAERTKPEPDMRKVVSLISSDVSISAAMLKTVNSPLYGLRSKVASVQQAIQFLGLKNVANLLTGLVLKNSFAGSAQTMERFWESAAHVAMISHSLAGMLPGVPKDEAYTFGLFRDCGIPAMMLKFPDYKDTLAEANSSRNESFTDIEVRKHGVAHTTVGSVMAKSWYLPDMISSAILNHHNHDIFGETAEDSIDVATLVAVIRLAEHISHTFLRMSEDADWDALRPLIFDYLGLSEGEYEDLKENIHAMLEKA